jgi:hypothetical protein
MDAGLTRRQSEFGHKQPNSDTYLRYVPVKPSFAPDGTAASRAEDFARRRVDAEAITSRSTAKIEFIDAGENWEGALLAMRCRCRALVGRRLERPQG